MSVSRAHMSTPVSSSKRPHRSWNESDDGLLLLLLEHPDPLGQPLLPEPSAITASLRAILAW